MKNNPRPKTETFDENFAKNAYDSDGDDDSESSSDDESEDEGTDYPAPSPKVCEIHGKMTTIIEAIFNDMDSPLSGDSLRRVTRGSSVSTRYSVKMSGCT